MIYQLKITLSHAKPPIWRRILIDSESTFEELDELIQMMFDWEDGHLHQFEMKKTNGKPVYTFINPTLFDDEMEPGPLLNSFFATSPPLKTEEEKLCDHFTSEKDRCIYTYDLKANWQHEIILEKFVEHDEHISYPYCVKAMRPAPGENPLIKSTQEGLDNAALQELINMQIAELIEEMFPTSFSIDSSFQKGVQLLELTSAYNKLALWESISDDQIIVIWVPSLQDYAYCSILGSAEKEFGLACYLGDDGLMALLSTVNGLDHYEEIVLFQQRSLLLSLSDRDELEKEDYTFIKQHNFSFRGKKQWPLFRSFKPGFYPWFLNDEEMIILNGILEQIIELAPFIKLNPQALPTVDADQWLTRKLDENHFWHTCYTTPTFQTENNTECFINELDLKRTQKQFPVNNVNLEIGSIFSQEPMKTETEERPFYPLLFIVTDKQNGMIPFIETVKYENYIEVSQTIMMKMIQSLHFIPKQIDVESESLYDALFPLLEKLPIKLNLVDQFIHFDKAANSILSSIENEFY